MKQLYSRNPFVILHGLLFLVGSLLSINVSAWAKESCNTSWHFVGAPLDDANIQGIRVDHENDSTWYVASHSYGVYVTRDGGVTWEQHLDGNVGAIEMDPNNTNVLYASSGSDLYRSPDRGATWHLVHSFPQTINGAPTFVDSLVVGRNDGIIFVGLTPGRIYQSSDGGVSWVISFETVLDLHIWDIEEDEGNGFLYFCSESASFHDPAPFMRSRDRGATWEDITPDSGPHGYHNNIQVDSLNHILYFLSESRFLYKSKDFGATWQEHGVDWFPNNFCCVLLLDKAHPNRLFGGEVATGLKIGGVYFSADAGESAPTFIGLDNRNIASLALNSTGTRLLAVAYGEGIYVTEFICNHPVPAFSGWGVLSLALSISAIALWAMRRKVRT